MCCYTSYAVHKCTRNAPLSTLLLQSYQHQAIFALYLFVTAVLQTPANSNGENETANGVVFKILIFQCG